MSAPFDTVREALDVLHLQAHEGGPTTDLSTHRRRAARLWNAAAQTYEAPGTGVRALPWEALPEPTRAVVADVVARAVQDVLEAEQVMYLALSQVIGLAHEKRAAAIDLAGSPRAKDLHRAAGMNEVVEAVERTALAALDGAPTPTPKDGRA